MPITRIKNINKIYLSAFIVGCCLTKDNYFIKDVVMLDLNKLLKQPLNSHNEQDK